MSDRRRLLSTLSFVLLGVTVVILVGGLIYDGTKDGEDPNLSWLYAIGVAAGLLAMVLGYQARGKANH
jgi:hypothetical protein